MSRVRKPLPTIGVDKYTFFPVTSDTASGVAYGQAVEYPGTVQITPTDNGGSDVFDADNGAYDVETYIEKIGHEIENADIPAEVEAAWRGLTKTNGGVLSNGSPKTVYFGVAWRLLKTDGTYRYVKYFKGAYSFGSNVGGKTRPSSGAAEKQTSKAAYTAVKLDYNGNMYFYVDSADVETGSGKTYSNLAAFETAWFSDMGALLGDSNITTATGA